VLSGRSGGLAGVESMVGPLLNTLPVRVKVPPHQQSGLLRHRVDQDCGRERGESSQRCND